MIKIWVDKTRQENLFLQGNYNTVTKINRIIGGYDISIKTII